MAARRERNWVRRALDYWRADAPVAQEVLSGASILTRRSVHEDVGGFDPRFHLYFEDTDWCRRVRQGGHRLFCVPGADVAHFYNQSARQDPAPAARAFAASEAAYFEKHYGARLWGFLSGAAARFRACRRGALPSDDARDLGAISTPPRFSVPGTRGESLLLVSPLPSCVPAAGQFLAEPEGEVPSSVWGSLAEGEFHARLLSLPDLRELGRWRWWKVSTDVRPARVGGS
jgi:hypothetical protein